MTFSGTIMEILMADNHDGLTAALAEFVSAQPRTPWENLLQSLIGETFGLIQQATPGNSETVQHMLNLHSSRYAYSPKAP